MTRCKWSWEMILTKLCGTMGQKGASYHRSPQKGLNTRGQQCSTASALTPTPLTPIPAPRILPLSHPSPAPLVHLHTPPQGHNLGIQGWGGATKMGETSDQREAWKRMGQAIWDKCTPGTPKMLLVTLGRGMASPAEVGSAPTTVLLTAPARQSP